MLGATLIRRRAEYNKGDVYLRDMRNTKSVMLLLQSAMTDWRSGHVAEINGGSWHPTDAHQFLTCSNDSTIRSVPPSPVRSSSSSRIWDSENKRKQKHVIVVKSKERGARTKVTSCAWSHDGRLVAGGTTLLRAKSQADREACMDGTLNVWSTNSNFARPDKTNETAHVKDTETSGVAFARDGYRIATRGGDDTVKRVLVL